MQGVKIAVEEEPASYVQYICHSFHYKGSTSFSSDHPSSSPSQRQAQILQNQLSPQELAYQESLTQEREQEIREIETGIHELSEIFRDLGTLVQEQGGMLGELLFSP